MCAHCMATDGPRRGHAVQAHALQTLTMLLRLISALFTARHVTPYVLAAPQTDRDKAIALQALTTPLKQVMDFCIVHATHCYAL